MWFRPSEALLGGAGAALDLRVLRNAAAWSRKETETLKGKVREVREGTSTMMWAGVREPAGGNDAFPRPHHHPSATLETFGPLGLKREGEGAVRNSESELKP